MTTAPVYKILTPDQDAAFLKDGTFDGAPVDHSDGFIHLSAGSQVAETLSKHFAGDGPLVLLALDPATMPDGTLKWEISRGGAHFPHLYSQMTADMVLWRETSADRAFLAERCKT